MRFVPFSRTDVVAMTALLLAVSLAEPALAQSAVVAGPTRVTAGFLAMSDPYGPAYAGMTRGVSGKTDTSTTIGFHGTDSEGATWGIDSSYTNSMSSSPTLRMAGSVTGTVAEGSTLFASGHGEAEVSFRTNCAPQPSCLNLLADVTISGLVQTSAALSLAGGQAMPTQPAHAYAVVEIGTDAAIRAGSPSLGSSNFLDSRYNVFLSQGYWAEGFSPSAGVHTGIDIRASIDALDPSVGQIGITTHQQVLGGSFLASPPVQPFLIHAVAVPGSFYSVSVYGEIGVLSTRLGDTASVSLLIDPVIAIDPVFALAHPDVQFSIEVAAGVGNVAAPVPEAACWAMMLAGLGLLGGMRWRTRRRPAPT